MDAAGTEGINMFEIPTYRIKRSMAELHPKTYEPWVSRWMSEKNIEAVALELREGVLICHIERVVSSQEA